ncbi:MAG TPA: peptidoglycan editing factor PgeF [Candidatus Ozemobacteraceae bacterium]|nr:peptidoglycan editing factor PgeF [Candidatus Ozemobacteraceae bacterium]
MHLIREGEILAAFSERADGDLGFYRQHRDMAEAAWQGLDVVLHTGLKAPFWATQVHGNAIHEVTADAKPGDQGDGDALVTAERGLTIGVFTADCLPVLIWSKSAIAAVHAGWKGTRSDIVGHTIRALADRFGADPASMHVAMGPCIGSCCLELGEEVPPAFCDADEGFMGFFSRGAKWHLDLRGLNAAQCLRRGVRLENIRHLNDCTMCLPERYFSYRGQKGRQGSLFSFVMRA